MNKLLPLFLCRLCVVCFVSNGESATWTSLSGTTIEAELTALDGDSVVLKTAQGRSFTIGLLSLDEPSRKQAAPRIEALRKEAVKAAAGAAADLSVIVPDRFIPRGETVLKRFEFPKFDAVVYNPSGDMDVFLKDRGQYVAPPFSVRLCTFYYIGGRHSFRFVKSHVEPPLVGKDEVYVKALRDDDVYTETYYKLTSEEIRVGFLSKDPDDIKTSTERIMLQLIVPALFTSAGSGESAQFFNPLHGRELTDAQATKKAAAFSLVLKPKQGQSKTFPYNVSVERLMGGLQRGIIGGNGLFGQREVTVDGPDDKNSDLISHIYPGFTLMQGFKFWMVHDDPSRSSPQKPAQQLRLKIK